MSLIIIVEKKTFTTIIKLKKDSFFVFNTTNIYTILYYSLSICPFSFVQTNDLKNQVSDFTVSYTQQIIFLTEIGSASIVDTVTIIIPPSNAFTGRNGFYIFRKNTI